MDKRVNIRKQYQFRFDGASLLERWIRRQRPFMAAVRELIVRPQE